MIIQVLPFQRSTTYMHLFKFCVRFTSHRMKSLASTPFVRTVLNTQKFDFFAFNSPVVPETKSVALRQKIKECWDNFFEEL